MRHALCCTFVGVALLTCPVVSNGQIGLEFAFSEFNVDSPPADLDRYIELNDLIAYFDIGLGASFEGGEIDPANGVEAFNFNYLGCLEQWDGVEDPDTVSPVDCYWHGFGTQCLPDVQTLHLTDGTGFQGVILRDFARAANVLRFDFESPTDIGEILVWTEDNTKGVRAFMHYDVYVSYDDSVTNLIPLAIGVRNGEFGISTNPGLYNSSYTHLYNCNGSPLATGVTKVRFVFYAVGTDGGDLLIDPWRGYWHPDNSAEWNACEATYPADPEDVDGRMKAFVTPNVAEIDILAPQPAPIPGDGDDDGDVDADDVALFGECLAGLNALTMPYDCRAFDFEGDCDVDLRDFGELQELF